MGERSKTINSIHQSTLNMALRCGEQFRRRYIEGEIVPPSIPAGRGTGVHKANEVNLNYKIKTKENAPLDDLRDAARDAYVHSFRNGVYLSKKDTPEKSKLLNRGLNDTIRCTDLYWNEVAPLIHPTAIEEEFSINVGLGITLDGRQDYQEEPRVGDLKTTSMKWPEGRIKEEIQVPFYSYAFEHKKGIRPEFRYDVLIARNGKGGEPTSTMYQPLTYTCTDADYNALFAKLHLFIKMLKAGIFPPTHPGNWVCSAKWCGYYSTCPYVGNSLPGKEI